MVPLSQELAAPFADSSGIPNATWAGERTGKAHGMEKQTDGEK